MKRLSVVLPSVLTALGLLAFAAPAQVVQVTVRLDDPAITAGATTRVRVFAQVAAERRATTDRVFSWYVDFLTSPSFARADYNQLQKSTSDQDPRTSSSGNPDGANLQGIFDTFLNRPGAGVSEPVELFSVPITGIAPGRVVFRVRAGTGVPGLSADFIVAPKGGGDPLLGGVYDAATATLDVTEGAPPCNVILTAVREPISAGQNRVTLSFTPCAGRTHFVEFRDNLTSGAWAPLPNGPHNSGTLSDTTLVGERFYRVRIEGGGGQPPCTPQLSLARQRLPSGQDEFVLTFGPCPGRDHFVEFRDNLLTGSWASLPSAPHNLGVLTNVSSATHRFYRLRIQ